MHEGSGATPELSMEQLTDVGLTIGSIREALGILKLEDLQKCWEFASALSGKAKDSQSLGLEDLRTRFLDHVRSFSESEPLKLAKVAEFVDATARERFKKNLANFRNTAAAHR